MKFPFVFFIFAISGALCAPTESQAEKRTASPAEVIWSPFLKFVKGYYKLVYTIGIKPFESLLGLIFGGKIDCVEQEHNAELLYKSVPHHDTTHKHVCYGNLIKVDDGKPFRKKDRGYIILVPASCIRGPDPFPRDPLNFQALVDGNSYKVIDKFEYDGDESDASQMKKKYALVKVADRVPFTETFRPTCVTDDRIKQWAERFMKKA